MSANTDIRTNNVGGYTFADQMLASGTWDINSTADQIITLSGGTEFIITNVVIYHPSAAVTTAKNGEIWTGAIRTGAQLFDTLTFANDGMDVLTAITSYISTLSGTFAYVSCWPPPCAGAISIASTTLYFSLGIAEGAALTASYRIYGYKIA
jgi:hypothetical protein